MTIVRLIRANLFIFFPSLFLQDPEAGKIIVFLASRDTVDFHLDLLSNTLESKTVGERDRNVQAETWFALFIELMSTFGDKN